VAEDRSDLEKLFQRIITEGGFFDHLMKHPVEALRDAGLEVTTARVEAIQKLDPAALKRMADVFGPGIEIVC
jgi:hypothetical protein